MQHDFGGFKNASGITHVGNSYQANIPNLKITPLTENDVQQNEISIWIPTDKIHPNELADFIQYSKGKNCPEDDALQILYNLDYDLKEAHAQIDTTTQPHWNKEDVESFERGLYLFGKNFVLIQSLIKHKTVGDLVDFYYRNKHKRYFHESQNKKLLQNSVKPQRGRPPKRDSLKPQIDSTTIYDALTFNYYLSSHHQIYEECKRMSKEIEEHKNDLEMIGKIEMGDIDKFRPKNVETTSEWTPTDAAFAVNAFYIYGHDYHSIAGIVGNKTVEDVRNYIASNKEMFKCD